MEKGTKQAQTTQRRTKKVKRTKTFKSHRMTTKLLQGKMAKEANSIRYLKVQELTMSTIFREREMIFVKIICDNFFFHAHIMFLLFFSIALVSMSISTFLYTFMVVPKIINQMIVEITHLLAKS